MEYPHKRYIRFLISKRLRNYEIVTECLAQKLLGPNDDDLLDFMREMGTFPSYWEPRYDPANKPFKRWLMDEDLFEFWNPDQDTKEAGQFLVSFRTRQAFESLMLLHGDVEICRTELLNTFPARWVPSLGVLELYCHFYWDIGNMTKEGLFDYLTLQKDEDVKLDAFGGELELTYARLGLKQRIEATDFLDRFVQLANLSTINHLRVGGIGNAAMAAGHAALGRAAMDAIAMREEFSQVDGASTIRKDAQLFKADLTKTRAMTIPSIDDLRGDVIDASEFEPEEEATGNGAIVHRLPTRR